MQFDGLTPEAGRMTIEYYPPDSVMPSHSHEKASLSFLLSGSVCETVSGREEIGRVGSIVFKPAGVDHGNRFGSTGARMICVRSPPAIERFQRFGWAWLHGPAVAKLTFQLAPEYLRGDEFGEVEEQLLHLIDALEGECISVYERRIPPWLNRVRDQLHADPQSRPSVEALARQAGVHPVHLSRRFRQAYGAPVSYYSRWLRVMLAADRIRYSRESLTEIAHALGFADQSHFCRVFARQFGISAGRYRKLVQESPNGWRGSGEAARF